MDAVAHYRSASEENDIDALVQILSEDAELVSPLSGHMVFRGRDDLRILLGAVYGTVTELRWNRELVDGDARVVIGECRIGPLKLGDAMILELTADGRVRRIHPHLRPWLALTLFALMLGPKLARHPGVLVRALRTA
jgi:ketosteroid isomerase-like protein